MPRLRDVIAEADRDRFRASPAHAFADAAVLALKLTTGAPCGAHAALFGEWPGPESHVRRFFVLDNGKAVGLDEPPDRPRRFAVVDFEAD